MPQTTNNEPTACARVEVSITSTCASWINVSGSMNSVQSTAQSRNVGDEYTFDGDGALSLPGKLQPFDATFRCVFNNVSNEAYRTAREQFQQPNCGSRICVRWVPGGAVGDQGFQSGYDPLISLEWPPIDAAAGGPVMCVFTVHITEIDPFIYVS